MRFYYWRTPRNEDEAIRALLELARGLISNRDAIDIILAAGHRNGGFSIVQSELCHVEYTVNFLARFWRNESLGTLDGIGTPCDVPHVPRWLTNATAPVDMGKHLLASALDLSRRDTPYFKTLVAALHVIDSVLKTLNVERDEDGLIAHPSRCQRGRK